VLCPAHIGFGPATEALEVMGDEETIVTEILAVLHPVASVTVTV
jgi:hypothetical protein